jgi:type VI secretion system protein ImpG
LAKSPANRMTVDGEADLLSLYMEELAYLRTAGAAFALKYPNVAEHLELADRGSADPQIQRLVEAFAFLTARLQHQYNAQFPEIPAALLGILYPQLVAPVPSMAIAEFRPDPEQSRSLSGFTLPAGTALFATAQDAMACWFRTCYPVTLWPMEVTDVAFEPPAIYPFLDNRADIASCLRVRLSCMGNRNFTEFAPSSLRLFLHGGWMTRFTLYELLCNQLRGIAVLPDRGDGAAAASPVVLANSQLRSVGFEAEHAVLPSPASAHRGFTLLQEYFTFPDKFLFLDLESWPAEALSGSRSADLLFLLAERPRQHPVVDAGTIRLGCAPIINLFARTTEPIRLDHTRLEYRLVPDSRWENCTEIHSIVRVSRSAGAADSTRLIRPFFSFTHAETAEKDAALWLARRQPISNPALTGTEMWLSFVDPQLNPAEPAGDVVFAHTLCTSRNLAGQIPGGALLQLEVDAPLREVVCLAKPTAQIDPPLAGTTLWQLISHLSVNMLSLQGGAESLAALREILHLYCGPQGASAARQIAGLAALSTRRIVRRIGDDAWRGFVRGVEVSLEFDEEQFAGASAFLLGAVLDRFFSLYAGVNAFTELVVSSKQRDGVWKRWPPRAGEAFVL